MIEAELGDKHLCLLTPPMKQIALTRNKYALVDDADFDYLNQWKWYCDARGYAARINISAGKRQNPFW